MLLYKDKEGSSICIIKWVSEVPAWCQALYHSKTRAQQYMASRVALSKILKTHDLSLGPQDIQIINHHNLKAHPHLLISLSHTKNSWAVGMVSHEKLQVGIGIDLELTSRVVKPETQKFFVNKKDSFESLLSLWSQKEACFKALSPFVGPEVLNKTFILKDIRIENGRFGLQKDHHILGKVQSEKKIINGQELLMSKAFLTKRPC